MIPEILLNVVDSQILGHPFWVWAVFLGVVLLLLFADLGIFSRECKEIGFRQSMYMSAFYISIGLLFGLWVWFDSGADSGMNYYTVYVLEKSLSLDNLFVMSVIFTSLHIPRKYQHRLLFWGVLGVLVLRGLMIGTGAALVHSYGWVLYVFAAILVWTGVKLMMIDDEEEEDYSQKPYVKFLARYLRVSDKIHGSRFFTRTEVYGKEDKKGWHATPLFLALCVIEVTDILFAFDSVPAALSLTTEFYVVYTANIFAILGLRALYFAVENVIYRFEYIKYSLSIVLIFIGMKVYYGHFFGDIHPAVSLGITIGVLVAGAVFSILKTRRDTAEESE